MSKSALIGLLGPLLFCHEAAAGGATASLLLGNGAGPAVVPLNYVQAAQASFSYSATFTGAPAVGDVIVAYGFNTACPGGGPPQSAPSLGSGWTSIATHTSSALVTPPGAALAYKIAGASEPTTETPFSGTPSAGGVAIVDLGNPSGTSFAGFSVTSQIVDNTYVAPGTAFPVSATPSATPSQSTSLLIAFGGWISCGVGAGAANLSINSGWVNVATSSHAGPTNDASVLSATQAVVGTSTVTATIQWTLNAAYGLDGAIVAFNHP